MIRVRVQMRLTTRSACLFPVLVSRRTFRASKQLGQENLWCILDVRAHLTIINGFPGRQAAEYTVSKLVGPT